MGIESKTPNIAAIIEGKKQIYYRRLIRVLNYVGEQCVNQARSGKGKIKDFTDRTGNLRSSIGYVVVKDGVIVKKNFTESGNGTQSGKAGKKEGKALAESLAKQTKGFCLIVVAGERYAVYVKNKGFDVIDSAELLARKIVPQLLAKLGND